MDYAHILIVRRYSWRVVDRVNVERHPRLLCDRIRRAAAVFMGHRPLFGYPKVEHGAFWARLDEGNLFVGRRLTDVEHVTALGKMP